MAVETRDLSFPFPSNNSSAGAVSLRPGPSAADPAAASSRKGYGGGGLKRAFDVVAAAGFLIVTAPLFALIAIGIKLDTRGPVFFRQKRVGRGGGLFLMTKFRKMPVDLRTQGPLLTRRSDPRLTRVGRWLERTKFDELPQLINILAGEMSMIGPRPEVPEFVDLNDPLWRVVLSVRPGLFGISQIQGRNESSLYPDGCEDLNGYYRRHILPEKLQRDALYVRRAGLLRDMELLFRGVMVAAFGTVTGSLIRAHAPGIAMLCTDVIAAGISFLFSYYVRLRTHLPMPTPETLWMFLSLCLLSRSIVFVMMGVYRRKPGTLTHGDFVRIINSVLYSTALLLLFSSLLVKGGVARSVLLVDTLTLSAVLVAKAYGIHKLIRRYRERSRRWSLVRAAVAMAVGAGLSSLAFYILLKWLSPAELAGAPIRQSVGLMLGFAAIRGYGICRYGLSRPTAGFARSLLDVPRILRGLVLGSLFLYVSDMVFYSQLVTVRVLAAELVLSTLLIMALDRVYWRETRAEAARRKSLASGDAERVPRVLLVGITAETEFYLSYLERVPRLIVVGVVDGSPGIARAHTVDNVPVIGGVGDLDAYLQAHPVDQVVYFPGALTSSQHAMLEAAGERHEIPVRRFPDLVNLAPAWESPAGSLGEAVSAQY